MDEKWLTWYKTTVSPFVAPSSVEWKFPAGADLALLAADTDRTQSYIFENTKLPEIRGGSELLRALNEEGLIKVLENAGLPSGFIDDENNPGCVIYAGGGGLLAFVPASRAGDLAAQMEALYPRETGKATITCVYRRITPEEIIYGLKDKLLSADAVNARLSQLNEKDRQRIAQIPEQRKGFGQLVQMMGIMLRQKKDNPPVLPATETLAFAARCQACQVRPAQRVYTYFDEPWPLCDVCRRKVQAQIGGAKKGRQQQVDRFTEWLKDHPDLEKQYAGVSPKQPVHLAQDLAELGATCQSRPGYVGFIYADGNNIGKTLESLPTPCAYRKFSAALANTLKAALYQALAEHLEPTKIDRVTPQGKPLGQGYIHPLEPLVIGGDDIIVLVPGDAGLPVATRLCQLFERGMRQAVPEVIWEALPECLRHPTLSVGLVIADSHNPVSVLEQVARELCKSAKRRAHTERQQSPAHYTSTLDFLLLKSQSMLRRDVRQLRRTHPYYFRDAGQEARLLTATPYTLEEMCRLLNILRAMRQTDFPVSQFQGIVAALQRGRRYGSINYLYQEARLRARLGEARRKENILSYLQDIWHYDNKNDPIPWQRIPDAEERLFASIIPDLLELYPFVPQKGNRLWRTILEEDAA
ncbi:MAG TPA: hypothetical protein PLJ78_14135 [Anaerolineae bacterium]|nr:hypothetical protein [Anaerolineae bacterium]